MPESKVKKRLRTKVFIAKHAQPVARRKTVECEGCHRLIGETTPRETHRSQTVCRLCVQAMKELV